MAQKVSIDYEHRGKSHNTVLCSKDLSVFSKAAKRADIVAKKGEDLVEALLTNFPGSFSGVERYAEGKLNDGPNGEHAVQVFDDEGLLVHAKICKDGVVMRTLRVEELAACNFEMKRRAQIKAIQSSFEGRIKVLNPG